MAIVSQKEAARRFARAWKDRGDERRDCSKFWLQLLSEVFRIEDPFRLIDFEKPVKMESSTRFIDAYIPATRVLIEQKGVDVDLSRKYVQSGGDELSPFEQARRYDQWMLPDEHPLWIVVCNFRSFEVHDMRRPFDAPEVVLLENLADEYMRLSFITDAHRLHVQREQKVSMDAGEIVGRIYDALEAQYVNPDDESARHSLNVLCTRFVFCLYAEDAGIFGKDQFHDYLEGIAAEDMRDAVLKLFDVLDTPEQERSPYLKASLRAFPYTNGGLFRDRDIEVPMFTDEIKEVLVTNASSGFDWSAISPTIFGAVFESTLNPETRRGNGIHYTSIENIHKVIDPLFLDDLKQEFLSLKDARPVGGRRDRELEWRRRMVAFQERLAALKFLDPACGSGNFLTETYLSLRRIENGIIRELCDGNMVLGMDDELIRVQISQFYGIEVNDFAADVARTALWISESQMMEETRNIVQRDMDFLPLKSNSNIRTGNALLVDWNDVVPASELNYIMGNPPFVGASMMSSDQKKEAVAIYGDLKLSNSIDYVGAWYHLCGRAMCSNPSIRAALVSTNSITQGEQVTPLWQPLFDRYGIHIDFAYRTFIWDSETHDKAHVHVVIIGFSRGPFSSGIIFDGGSATAVSSISPYLVEGGRITVSSRGRPLCDVPAMTKGNQPTDGGNLILSVEERDRLLADDPSVAPFVRRYIGARDFINGNEERYCLWLKDVPPHLYAGNPEIRRRLSEVRRLRLESTAEPTRRSADTPYKFFSTPQTDTSYLIIPRVSSCRRPYIPIGMMDGKDIAADSCSIVLDAKLYHFAVLSSSVHMAWVKVVGGRLKSDFRYSGNVVYNCFPWPFPSDVQMRSIESTARSVLEVRASYPDSSLAVLYDDLTMPAELRKAHRANDAAVMEAYGFRSDMTESDVVAELFRLYGELVSRG